MTLRYRVTLTGIKGFYRVYYLDSTTSLYTFHKQMQADLEFPRDQLIMFKALDGTGGVVARYGLFDLGSGTVDAVPVGDTVAAGVASFTYFYDVTNKKSVDIAFEGEVDGERTAPGSPRLVDVKGPVPAEFENGYVAYEDLPDEQKHIGLGKRDSAGGEEDDDDPDDFDDDEDDAPEEADDDEDGKEIFDESEDL